MADIQEQLRFLVVVNETFNGLIQQLATIIKQKRAEVHAHVPGDLPL